MADMEKIKRHFRHIWDCEIIHPIFQDRVSEIVEKTVEMVEQERRWIPVTERMPDEDDEVLVLIGADCFVMRLVNKDKPDVWHWDGSYYMEWQNFNGTEHADICDVTHWMPLPQPPKEGKQG